MKSVLHKGLWFTAGVLCILLGVIGVILPIMPGLIFFVLAIFCFMRASRRFHCLMEQQHWFTRIKEIFHRYVHKH